MFHRPTQLQVLELLGEGSQGCVHKAIRLDRASGMQQTVAIKILHSRNAVELWRQEFESLSRVRSNHCVRVLYFERYRRKPALVMEFVDGLSLQQLAQAARLDDDDILEIIAQMESGLRDLHAQGLSHGDLSPQNVLVDINGHVRLLDFGLANGCHRQPRLTPQFAAPERLRGESASASADLFSLGRLQVFLRRESMPNSNYLHDDPRQRRFQHLSSSPARQFQLGQKVSEVKQQLNRAQDFGTHTQGGFVPPRPLRRLPRLALLASLLFSLSLAAPSASHSARAVPSGMLLVHTHRWHFIYINDKPVGYAPLSLPLAAGEAFTLRWLNADGGGERRVTLRAQESRLLTDSDFSH